MINTLSKKQNKILFLFIIIIISSSLFYIQYTSNQNKTNMGFKSNGLIYKELKLNKLTIKNQNEASFILIEGKLEDESDSININKSIIRVFNETHSVMILFNQTANCNLNLPGIGFSINKTKSTDYSINVYENTIICLKLPSIFSNQENITFEFLPKVGTPSYIVLERSLQ